MGFSRQEYWSGLPFPFPGNLPDPGIEPASRTSPALVGRFLTTSAWTGLQKIGNDLVAKQRCVSIVFMYSSLCMYMYVYMMK